MLKNVSIKNYRCFRDVSVELKPLTVLIGVNGTGKSTFFRAVSHFAKSSQVEGFTGDDVFQRQKGLKIEIILETLNGDFKRGFDAEHSRASPHRLIRRVEAGVLPKKEFSASLVRLPAAGCVCQSGGIPDNLEAMLSSDGGNVASVLDYMCRNNRSLFLQLERTLSGLVPGLMEIHPKHPDPSMRRLSVTVDSGFQLDASELSTGVRHLICFATLAFQSPSPDVLLIEEPECGVHPKRVGDIVKLLRGLSTGEFSGKPTQVILATHSPYLLDEINIQSDQEQVLVFRRDDSGERIVEAVDRERLKVFLDEFMLGEIWFNQNEEGLLKKRS
jgi:predicted ATPase